MSARRAGLWLTDSTALIVRPWRRHSWRKYRKYSSPLGEISLNTAMRVYPWRFNQPTTSAASPPTSPLPRRKQYSPARRSVPAQLMSGTSSSLASGATVMALSELYAPATPMQPSSTR